MLQIDLDELSEKDLQALLGTTENFRMEFKGTLDLTTSSQRLEAAKDISAFANSAGGRIFYGICEHKNDDGSRSADRIEPLTDLGLQTRLEDLVADTIHPRPHWRARPVKVEGGFVLVAEVYSSLGRDLHMVSSDRFYKRGETRTVKMTEPEIRESYQRISISNLAMEQALSTKVKEQEALAPNCFQSVMILPLYPKWNLVIPRIFKDMSTYLQEGPFKNYCDQSPLNVSGHVNGLRAHIDGINGFDFFVTRSGVAHFASSNALEKDIQKSRIDSVYLLENILTGIRSARLVLDHCHYWGPVHVVQILNVPNATDIRLENSRIYRRTLGEGRYEQAVPEVNLAELKSEMIARDLCDQLFQALGGISCPLFNEDGSIRDEVRKWARL